MSDLKRVEFDHKSCKSYATEANAVTAVTKLFQSCSEPEVNYLLAVDAGRVFPVILLKASQHHLAMFVANRGFMVRTF